MELLSKVRASPLQNFFFVEGAPLNPREEPATPTVEGDSGSQRTNCLHLIAYSKQVYLLGLTGHSGLVHKLKIPLYTAVNKALPKM